jgi:hypothetical protein
MEKDRIEMSQRERDVLKVMALVLKGERTQAEAARLLKRSVRQVRRLQRRLESRGDGAVVHGLRGRPSNRRVDLAVRQAALALYRSKYLGFGPTLAAEKLAEADRLEVKVRTLREWLLAEGLWTRQRRRDRHRSRRVRRACLGEMVQADASLHDWLEGRGPAMALVGIIDDATGRVLARFYPAESTEAYMERPPIAEYRDWSLTCWGGGSSGTGARWPGTATVTASSGPRAGCWATTSRSRSPRSFPGHWRSWALS